MSGCKNWGDDSYGFMGRLECLGVRTRDETDMGSWEDLSVRTGEMTTMGS